ncbi:MAG: ferrous iron transporter B [Eubacteriales bacterium]|nr:ferrous iron transporter B [Eubacteriales bacterium]
MKSKKVLLMGNPNVGKSTVFNEITGMHQHTGNWTGKTVDSAIGKYYYKYNNYELIDLPGTYSLIASSKEEEVAGNYLLNENYDCVVIVIDATLLQRNLMLFYQIFDITSKVVVLLNLCDEAKKRNIEIDKNILQNLLGVPVIKATARSGKGINELLEEIHLVVTNEEDYYTKRNVNIDKIDTDNILEKAQFVSSKAIKTIPSKKEKRDEILDKILLGKYTSIPIMLLIFGLILFITIRLSNYPSEFLSDIFSKFEVFLSNKMTDSGISPILISLLVDGMLKVLLWVIAVMLPPIVIFFPLFSLLEDFGILPRFAFNLDSPFEKCNACGKQALTTCMGLGCNAIGVTGARIIDSKRERNIAIITNSLTPCNGRFPFLIAVISIFLAKNSITASLILLSFIVLSVIVTMICSKILSKTALKGKSGSLIFELPKYRVPNFKNVIKSTFRDKILFVLFRAVIVSIPAGLIIWALANIDVNGISLLNILSVKLDAFGKIIGLDGVMLVAFILGLPANEIVLPIALMAYLSTNVMNDYSSIESLSAILVSNGWTIKTAICACVFSMFHFPCATTLLTIGKETKSIKYTLLSIITPLLSGIIICTVINALFSIFS